jgi:hypothetical protein
MLTLPWFLRFRYFWTFIFQHSAVFRIRIRKFLGLPDLLVRSTHHQTKLVRKTLISTVLLLLYDFLSFFKNDVNVPSKGNKQKQLIRMYKKSLDTVPSRGCFLTWGTGSWCVRAPAPPGTRPADCPGWTGLCAPAWNTQNIKLKGSTHINISGTVQQLTWNFSS